MKELKTERIYLVGDQIYVVTTIVVAIVYCIYLGRIKEDAIKK